MRRAVLVLTIFAIFDVVWPGAPMAADLPVAAGPVAAYSWNGFYIGATIGGAWSNSSVTGPAAGFSLNPGGAGFIGGMQTGYNIQSGNFVYGVEGDFDGSTLKGVTGLTPTPFGIVQASANRDWTATLAARFGITSDRWLIYGKVGGALAEGAASLTGAAAGPISFGSRTDGGFLLGGGLEYAFASNWTGKLEYDFIGLNTSGAFIGPFGSMSRNVQMLKVGLNYQFGERVSNDSGSVAAGTDAASDTQKLAQASQNPIADMISLPFQNNTNFNTGPFNRAQDILNIQPVIPMELNANWNVISRTIIPLMSQPSPAFDSNTNGIGDITESLFVSPSHPGPLIWGAGPVYTIPSASDPILGTGRVLAGPTAVALVTPGPWVIGALANNQWSVAGDPNRGPVNAFLVQPFINYNMAGGWYLTSAPIMTANWLAPTGQKWTVPLGGGFGRVFKFEGQAYNASIAAYDNVVSPTRGPDWQLRVSLALLFPK